MDAVVNRETPLAELVGATVVPTAQFYVRNHFPIPQLNPARRRLRVGGLVRRELCLELPDLFRMPGEIRTITLECAGNGRSSFQPVVEGEQWGLGAVGTAEWVGVPFAELLDRAGPLDGACNLVFRGADGFERALSLTEAAESGALLAYAMNGEALPADHGSPVRLLVPGWYAVASVKWLTEIEVTDRPFRGHFQTEKYVYDWEREGRQVSEPVRRQRVRALITEPVAGAEVAAGGVPVRGYAWSGEAPIDRVEVSLDRGPWQAARLLGARERYAWRRWEFLAELGRPGPVSLRARAVDAAGNTQPEQAEWNRQGYGNNAIQEVGVRVA